MVMEESVMHHHHSHSPSGGDTPTNSNSTNVYLVGLEFVRQYYTVLNQGPLYLHRFYSDDSSFVHGVSARDSKVAYGQQEIHKRIQSLNFHNCHAKIRQVDSHETLGNGVVIQVTGELSNNGQPMRRFMQTFVLAPQTPKRYYVRNDIFHYQDEVFCDDEMEGENAVETGLESEDQEDQEQQPLVDVNGEGGINIPGGVGMDQPSSIIPPSSIPSVPEVSVSIGIGGGGPPPHPPTTTKLSPIRNNKVEMQEEEHQPEAPIVVSAAIVQQQQQEPSIPPPEKIVTAQAVPIVSSVPVVLEEELPPVVVVNHSAPKTYANLFKNNSSVGVNVGPPRAAGPPPARYQAPPQKGNNGPGNQNNTQFSVNTNEGSGSSPPQVSPQPSSGSSAGPGGVNKGLPPRNPRGGQGGYRGDKGGDSNRTPGDRGGDRDSKERRERLTSRSSTTLNDDTGSIDGDRRRPVHTYPDANQLFVGNLPHFVTVEDMKEIFQEFGEVAEVKIQKPTPKSGGMKVPFFCFVVFEEASSARAAIDRKSEIFMKMHGGGHRRLNVEPKRSQRGGRDDDGPYNRMDTASPAGRTSEGGPRGGNSRTFRGSNRGGDRDRDQHRGGDRDQRDNRGDRDRDNRGPRGGGGGGGMNSGGRGGGQGGGQSRGGNKP